MIPRYAAVLLLAGFGLAQAPDHHGTPQWQLDAGGKAAFEVASVKLTEPDKLWASNFALDPDNSFAGRMGEAPNGRFSATSSLSTYIGFAYKFRFLTGQRSAMVSRLPKWVSTDVFEIEARAPGNPTKDQMRLMMQALLAERFRLVVHFETHEIPVLAMTLVRPGKTGPGLRPHAEGPSCDAPPSPEIYPPECGGMGWRFSDGGQRTGGARNATMVQVAWYGSSMGNLDRPVIDRTGLTGRFDFTIKWKPDPGSLGGPGRTIIFKNGSAPRPDPEPDADGPGFIQAVREQLGLKLESTKGPVETLVIDHIERPSEN